jgi:CheY-like chemotaxis protein
LKRVLVVEDNKLFVQVISKKLKIAGFEAVTCETLAETNAILEKEDDFFAAILDLALPDAPHGEVVDIILERNIPAIILTALFNDDIRDEMLHKSIVDYVVKNRQEDVDYAISLVQRLEKNAGGKVLIVDDSKMYRRLISTFVKDLGFIAITAENGVEALEIVKENPDLRMVLTDYTMPKMDGLELTLTLRKMYRRDQLDIIAVTGKGSQEIASKFLKFGANDYLQKPFTKEEFNNRVNKSLELIEHIAETEKKNTELANLYRELKGRVELGAQKNEEKEQLLSVQSRQAELGGMINSITHQWHQPLTLISMLAQETEALDPHVSNEKEHIHTNIQKIVGQIEYMSQTIHDFKNFFRPDKEKKFFTVKTSIESILRIIKSQLRFAEIELSIEGDLVLQAYGFVNEFKQAILIIINNARDALEMSESYERFINIHLSINNENAAQITISDNAGGIPKEILSKIFDPYFTTKDDEKGTGIGLSLAKSIVEDNMSGTIQAENLGNGAYFTITLPIEKP